MRACSLPKEPTPMTATLSLEDMIVEQHLTIYAASPRGKLKVHEPTIPCVRRQDGLKVGYENYVRWVGCSGARCARLRRIESRENDIAFVASLIGRLPVRLRRRIQIFSLGRRSELDPRFRWLRADGPP